MRGANTNPGAAAGRQGEPEAATATRLRPHPDLREFYGDGSERPDFVRGLFDDASPDYDRLSAILSFGTDRWYRRRALRQAGLGVGARVLDVATGTGLVVRAALELGCRPQDVVGLDPSAGMLAMQGGGRGVSRVRGTGERLPFRSGTFDYVTMGYALRHVEDLGALFREFHRVLRPEGRLVVLEISCPESAAVRGLMRLYFSWVVPWLLIGSKRRAASAQLMRYYWGTIEACVPPERIVGAMEAAGFGEVRRRATGPVLNDYLASK